MRICIDFAKDEQGAGSQVEEVIQLESIIESC